MTDAELDKLAFELPFVKAWVAAVEDELKSRAEAGSGFENVFLEPTRPTRKWDGDPLPLLLRFAPLDTVAPREPLSPAQAQKTLGKKLYDEYLIKSVVSQSSGMKLTFRTE
jgi:hypothetical protein